jgi:phosphoribosylglycinamide formyltransferase-1
MDAEIVLVLADEPGAPVLEVARRAGVAAEYLPPGTSRAMLPEEAEEAYVRRLRDAGVELVCLAGFMRIIRRPLLAAFPQRILNIHPSLLPSFPGLEAQRQALDYGVKIAGATVHIVDEGMDTGPIVVQEALEVGEDDTGERLAERILALEHRIYARAVNLFAQGRVRVEGRHVRVLPATGRSLEAGRRS